MCAVYPIFDILIEKVLGFTDTPLFSSLDMFGVFPLHSEVNLGVSIF